LPRQLVLSRESTGQVAAFLAKVIALEVVRRISKARCPFIWNSIQALQVLGYPPFRWIQRWAPLKFVVQGIQVILVVLSSSKPWISWTVQAAIFFWYKIIRAFANCELPEYCVSSSVSMKINKRIVLLLLFVSLEDLS
jgi:hypothetical protein